MMEKVSPLSIGSKSSWTGQGRLARGSQRSGPLYQCGKTLEKSHLSRTQSPYLENAACLTSYQGCGGSE